jgi:hypothetical protein
VTFKLAYFKALASFKGQVDGRCKSGPCDLTGRVKGKPTATDIIDQLEADTGQHIPAELRKDVLDSYVDAYNRAPVVVCEGV